LRSHANDVVLEPKPLALSPPRSKKAQPTALIEILASVCDTMSGCRNGMRLTSWTSLPNGSKHAKFSFIGSVAYAFAEGGRGEAASAWNT
jgi:hypothetical protein